MGRRKSCCVPAVRTTTDPCARNKFLKHIYNFLWALPSWKSLAPVHKMMGKITRKNIINICSSYRPCPVRSNIEKSTSGKVYKPIGDRLARPRYFPAVPWASVRPSCPVSGPTLSRTLRPNRVLQASWISVVSRLSHAESANLPKRKVGLSNRFRPSQGIRYTCTTSLLVITFVDWYALAGSC